MSYATYTIVSHKFNHTTPAAHARKYTSCSGYSRGVQSFIRENWKKTAFNIDIEGFFTQFKQFFLFSTFLYSFSFQFILILENCNLFLSFSLRLETFFFFLFLFILLAWNYYYYFFIYYFILHLIHFILISLAEIAKVMNRNKKWIYLSKWKWLEHYNITYYSTLSRGENWLNWCCLCIPRYLDILK